MLVLHKKNASTLYKNMLAKTVSLNQLMSMHWLYFLIFIMEQ